MTEPSDLSPYRALARRTQTPRPAQVVEWAGETLFLLASRELGSWRRWREIAELNALDALDPLTSLDELMARPASLSQHFPHEDTGLPVEVDLSEDTGICAQVGAYTGEVFGTGRLQITEHLEQGQTHYEARFALFGEDYGEPERFTPAEIEDLTGQARTKKLYLASEQARAMIELELDHDTLMKAWFAQEEGLFFTLTRDAGRAIQIPERTQSAV